jgi:hypothetical protein
VVAISFSALMPSVLRLVSTDESLGVHLTAQTTTPLADWGKCFRTEDEVERVLQVLEPLLVLLSVAGYGVPEVAMAGANAAQADVASVSMPALELRRGSAQAWTAAPGAQVGLRVCPTTANPLDLSGKLATYKPGFGIKACGWLMLPVSESDPVTSLDDLVRNKLWPALVSTVAAASAEVGVAALINHAAGYQIVSDVPVGASLSDLVANTRLKLNASGASGVLEAEFDAQDGGPSLGEQMQALAGSEDSLLTRVVTRGVVATTAELLWDYWQEDVPQAEPDEAPGIGNLEALGFVRALLSWVGTNEVVDTAPAVGTAPSLERPPLTRLIAVRSGKPPAMSDQDWNKFVAAEELYRSFVRMEWDATKRAAMPPVHCTVPRFTFTRSTEWDATQYPALEQALTDQPLTRTLDFARSRFELEVGAEGAGKPVGTVYLDIEKAKFADKQAIYSGIPDRNTFWCSALTIWTLSAAGYDLDQDVLGAPQADGHCEPHGYIDHNGWVAIRPWMLIDGQPEACMAVGLILNHARESDPQVDTLQRIPGRTVVFGFKWKTEVINGKPTEVPEFEPLVSIRDLSALKKPINTRPPLADAAKLSKPTLEQAQGQPIVKDKVPAGIDSKGFLRPYVLKELYEAGTYDGPTVAGRDYRDNPAVQYGPGTVQLLGLGHRVDSARIRPGDVGQYQERYLASGPYLGKGHAFQVWSVKATSQGKEVVIDAGTDPHSIPSDVEATAYRCIDANIANVGTHPYLMTGQDGVSISGWIPVANDTKLTLGRRYYFARLHESPWSDANLNAPVTTPATAPPSGAGPTPAPTPTPTPATATDSFDAPAASAHIDTLTAAYRNISAGGLTFKTKYRNTFLADHGGPYVAANYGGEEEADAFKNNYATYMAAMGKGSPEGVQKGVQASFDAGRIHADPEVNKAVSAALTMDDLEKYCHGRYGVDCIGFVLQALLTFPDYASYMPAHIAAKYPQPMSEKLSHFRRLAETNTADFEAASDELADPKTWRPLDVITWGGSGGSGHVILIRSTSLLASGIWEVQCAESVGGKWEVNGPKTSTYFYAPTADAAGLHWATSEADAMAGSMYGVILARATVRRARMEAVA